MSAGTEEHLSTTYQELTREDRVAALVSSALFSHGSAYEDALPYEERAILSVRRARALVKAYGLSVEEIADMKQPFWDFAAHPASILDSATAPHIAVQLNLVAGTLAKFVDRRPSYRQLLHDIIRFDIVAHLCLTEIGQGLDMKNLETTATLLLDGTYELHTPHPGAEKFMSPTVPCGVPAVGLVFARLIANGKDHGVRTFIMKLNDGRNMAPGITSKLLPPRGGTAPITYAVTKFNRVRLAPEALLGDIPGDADTRKDTRLSLELSDPTAVRRSAGALGTAVAGITSLQYAACIAGRYSVRRTIVGSSGRRVPVINMRTQHAPILAALACSFVFKAFSIVAIEAFCNRDLDFRIRHAWATIFKATVVHQARTMVLSLAPRCGGQGLFGCNGILKHHSTLLDATVAEGDVLVLSICLASELLLGRYKLPLSTHPYSLLALHEQGLLSESHAVLQTLTHHRSDDFNRLILPKSETIVRAIGSRMAYDAAVDSGLDKRIVDLYLAIALKMDAAWYVEHGTSRAALDTMEDKALSAALPCLEAWLDDTGLEQYVKVPILSQENWEGFISRLRTYGEPRNAELARL